MLDRISGIENTMLGEDQCQNCGLFKKAGTPVFMIVTRLSDKLNDDVKHYLCLECSKELCNNIYSFCIKNGAKLLKNKF